MLTVDEKHQRIQWAKRHKSGDFTRMIFTNEASFQHLRNAVWQWTKTHNELKCLPKKRRKVHI